MKYYYKFMRMLLNIYSEIIKMIKIITGIRFQNSVRHTGTVSDAKTRFEAIYNATAVIVSVSDSYSFLLGSESVFRF